ncbi:hypothetical protein AVEN_217789-1 [Araneus ventricosus]|uniref:Uncharacterized protein n=1 Tax=Araneus ventricosus TaxID=182803 RepID=A0A4Y2J3P0_ARAVE|nr:hypothetical protein AVEN_217789-1 [Araneus ventricosus]
MPVSVHEILFHGKDIIDSCILPIGQLSEEAREARNKHNRKFRELFTRKTSMIDTNKDLINGLLLTSDPFIASLRSRPKTERRKNSNEVRELLEIRAPAPIDQEQSYENLLIQKNLKVISKNHLINII